MSEVIVYGAGFSPFVRKILALCEIKNIDYRNVPVSPRNLPANLKVHTPLGKIPFAQIDDRWLCDSSVICDYLEHLFPKPALYPADPYDRAQALWFEEYIDGGLSPKFGPKIIYQRIVKPLFLGEIGDESLVQDALANDLPPAMSYLEQQIGANDYIVADMYSIADITVAGFFVNLMHCGIEIDGKRWPNIKRYVDEHWRRPEFVQLVGQEKQMFAELKPAAAK